MSSSGQHPSGRQRSARPSSRGSLDTLSLCGTDQTHGTSVTCSHGLPQGTAFATPSASSKCRGVSFKANLLSEGMPLRSIQQLSFGDPSGHKEMVSKPQTAHDLNVANAFEQAYKVGKQKMQTATIQKEFFVDFSGHKDALRPCDTLYTKLENARVQRAASFAALVAAGARSEPNQTRCRSTEQAGQAAARDRIRQLKEPQVRNFRQYTIGEMASAKTAPTMTKACGFVHG
eukprot:TRINITY_DN6762_c0_g2_i2.p1 TRINITY_DN6762_c0_g2~~TRINITY_DN6762_c0_g2_i2.p1  ORF type:complete len:231 (-),score=29.56 TRINITY_DN6762_c0_g2_i2:153-845(-)